MRTHLGASRAQQTKQNMIPVSPGMKMVSAPVANLAPFVSLMIKVSTVATCKMHGLVKFRTIT